MVHDLNPHIELFAGKTELSVCEAFSAACKERISEAFVCHKMDFTCIGAVHLYDAVLGFISVDLRTAGGIEIAFRQRAGDCFDGELRRIYHDPAAAVILQCKVCVVGRYAPYFPAAPEQRIPVVDTQAGMALHRTSVVIDLHGRITVQIDKICQFQAGPDWVVEDREIACPLDLIQRGLYGSQVLPFSHGEALLVRKSVFCGGLLSGCMASDAEYVVDAPWIGIVA